MSSYSQGSGGGGSAPPKKNSHKKGLGFVPSSIGSCITDPITSLLRTAPTIAKGSYASSQTSTLLSDSKATIPLFDLEKLFETTGRERQIATQAFGSAFMQVGILGIRAPNLSQMISGIYKEMDGYFRRPIETKLLDWKKGSSQSGYYYRGSETGPHAPRPDFKESFFITPNFKDWPSGNRTFPKMMSEYYASLARAYQYLSMFLMEFLQEPFDENLTQNGEHLLRLAYYPPFKPGDDPKGNWSAANRDKSVLSLSSVASIPGLQFYSSKGLWEPVIVPNDHLIVSAGLFLQYKTAGLIKARWKRVVNPGGKYTRLQRFSTVFYGTWPKNFSLKPFPNSLLHATSGMTLLRKEEYLKKYPDIQVKEKLT